MLQTSFIPQGWECPKCKRIYSPTTVMCSYCPQNNNSITSSGTTTYYSIHNFERSGTTDICKICGRQEYDHPIIRNT